jgi:hypothetical protein
MGQSAKRSGVKDPKSEPDKSIPASLDEALIDEFCHIIAGIIRRIMTDEAKKSRTNRKNKAPINLKRGNAKKPN